MNVLIAGGKGAIGKYLSSYLEKNGYKVSVLTRNKDKADGKRFFYWNTETNEIDRNCFTGINYLINLSGANISEKRWTVKRKKEIIDSRINPSGLLFQAVASENIRLKAFIGASAVGYYGAVTNDHIYTETDPPGNDFLAETCVKWENASAQFSESGIRTVILRTGIVLMKSEGALSKMMTAAKFYLSAPLGSGNQYFPWIHIDDLCGIYLKALTDESLKGVFNAVAPAETTNRKFTFALAKAVHKKVLLKSIPSFLLKIAFGELGVTLIFGSRISSEKILKYGFIYKYEDLEKALDNLLKMN